MGIPITGRAWQHTVDRRGGVVRKAVEWDLWRTAGDNATTSPSDTPQTPTDKSNDPDRPGHPHGRSGTGI